MAMLDRGARARGAACAYLEPDGQVLAGEHALRVRWTHLGESRSATDLASSEVARVASDAVRRLRHGSAALDDA